MAAYNEDDIRKLVQGLGNPENPTFNAQARHLLKKVVGDPASGLSDALLDETRRVLDLPSTHEISTPRPVWIQLYRTMPGDLEIGDIAWPADEDPIERARQTLLLQLQEAPRTGWEKPRYARVIDDRTGAELCLWRVTPAGTVEAAS
ncbi:hypothetical protein [Caulobacter sp. RHG1]|uniref:hypothetical protein n=1 Tax=Caulobacter sp. (strain RHG1) TaxID=2545762 RepID=UPI001553DFBB|nr:hypothetical protein [Caulobacter sp. RHG1]NQE61393.1 hypothetical protein [Caulobacter sp. RHG1]